MALAVACSSGCLLSDYRLAPAAAGLIAWWKLDDGLGPTAADSSGHGHTAALLNGPVWVGGRIGGALSFDGVDDLVDAGPTADLDLTGSFTIAAWIYPRSYGGAGLGRIVDRRQTPQGYALLLDDVDVSHGFALVSDGGTPSETTESNANAIVLNRWQHVAATYDSVPRLVSLYVDGASAGTGFWADGPMSSGNSLLLGSMGGQLRTFDGIIDDVRIYDRALSASEIQSVYAEAGRQLRP